MMFGTDLHSHILPKADHGSSSLQETAEQLRMLKNAGIDTVVATPHFYPAEHDFSVFSKRVQNATSQILTIPLAERPRIVLGAEVLVCTSLHRHPDLDRLCIAGTRTLLLELPLSGCNAEILQTVEDLIQKGYTVVLAHIDRYIKRYGDQIDALLSLGALAQINANSLKSFWDRRRLTPYLESPCVVGFGTDLHGTDRHAIVAYEALRHLPFDWFSQITERSNILLAGAEKW